MGLFDLFKKEQNKAKPESNTLLAMPMFNDGDLCEIDKIKDNLKTFWNFEITDYSGDKNVAVFKLNGESVAIANMDVPIPWGDIEGTAQYAYNWPNVLESLKDHTGHAIVTIMDGQKGPLERFKLLSKVLCAILMTSNSIGVYQGSQSLLIPSEQYLKNIEELKRDGTPVFLWVYIGLKKFKTGNSAYTYGLKYFQKQEIEIIDSTLSLEDLLEFLGNIASYVIANDVTLKNGQTVGYTSDQKINITISKAQFVEGQSIKLDI
ncbi:DUF4261 domain-containing protein [Mucilaginibacter gotjawali]|uniref:Uncharacterized protein n=2 Tax=Mucilaginibacter gotjawali TaxID=1550579 RepID=A0A839SG91_9SPHI|nr:DUF4261 domain-containing protein [Mucilaginibacter gotjawali]MBB3056342.1 hypothetical protein [Mucilaginibacter gotjawali]BAU55046.1 hypothetical protein MgSA37_03227 [Mucilaginibacter gotjawali]